MKKFITGCVLLLALIISGFVNRKMHSIAFFTNHQAIDSSVKIIDNYTRINSMKQLLEKFKGKPVFVDLWATWCEPCIEEFKYSNELHTFLNKEGIEMIYISFDKEDLDTVWRTTIIKNNLSGNHIKANKTLQDEITILIWGGVDAYSLPHYLLYNKKGKLIDNNLPEPSTASKLSDEIKLRLKE